MERRRSGVGTGTVKEEPKEISPTPNSLFPHHILHPFTSLCCIYFSSLSPFLSLTLKPSLLLLPQFPYPSINQLRCSFPPSFLPSHQLILRSILPHYLLLLLLKLTTNTISNSQDDSTEHTPHLQHKFTSNLQVISQV